MASGFGRLTKGPMQSGTPRADSQAEKVRLHGAVAGSLEILVGTQFGRKERIGGLTIEGQGVRVENNPGFWVRAHVSTLMHEQTSEQGTDVQAGREKGRFAGSKVGQQAEPGKW
eukprot:4478737-Pleurochrysis_carterae.AAC.1